MIDYNDTTGENSSGMQGKGIGASTLVEAEKKRREEEKKRRGGGGGGEEESRSQPPKG